MRSRCCSISSGSFDPAPGDLHRDLDAGAGGPQPRAGFDGRRQILPIQRRSAQIHHAAPRLGQAVARHAPRHVQVRAGRRGILRHAHGHGVQLRGDADEALRQRVVDFARQPGALLQHQPEPRADLAQPQLIDRPGRGQQCRHAQGTEPRRLPKLREHFELVGLLAARAAGQFRTHDESIVSVVQAVEIDDPPSAGRHPIRIQALQLVKILHPLRRAQMDAGVADLQAFGSLAPGAPRG